MRTALMTLVLIGTGCVLSFPDGAKCTTTADCPSGQICGMGVCGRGDGGSTGGGAGGGVSSAGGTSAGGSAGGATAGGSTAGGTTAGGSTAGGAPAGGSAGGATAGGTAGGTTAGGSTSGGSTSGGSAGGGSAGGGSAGGAPDTEAPLMLQTTPSTGSSNVAVGTTIQFVFSEPMDRASVLFSFAPNITFSSQVWSADSTTLTLTPATALQFNGNYSVSVNGRDAAGNAMNPSFSYAFSTEAMPDTTPPAISSTVPDDNATGVPVADGFLLRFSEPMEPASVQITLNPSVSLRSPTWSGNNTEFSANATAALMPSTLYVLTVTGRDVAGNNLTGLTVVRFTTAAPPDMTPPSLVSMSPDAGALNVPRSTVLTLTFDEPMNPGSLIVEPVPDPDLGPAVWSNQNRTVSFPTPVEAWPESQLVNVDVTARDVASNPLPRTSFSFQIADPPDTTAPVVNSTSPGNMATGVPFNTDIEFNFSEPMNRATTEGALTITPAASGAVTWNSAGTLMVFNPQMNLTPSIQYQVSLAATATDLAGNPLAAVHSFRFNTAAAPDTTAPTVVSTLPLNNAVGVPRSVGSGKGQTRSSISVTFSEPMNQGAVQGAFSITSPSGFNGGDFSWSGNTMTYRPLTYFAYGQQVTFEIRGGTSGARAQDLAGNPLAATVTRTYRIRQRTTAEFYGSVPALDGYLYATASCATLSLNAGSSIAVAGDTSTNTMYRGFLTFDLSTLPSSSLIISATLNVYQASCTSPGPFGGSFGTVGIEALHVAYGATLQASACSTPLLGGRRYGLSTGVGVTTRSVAVTAAVQDDFANRSARGNRSQYLLRHVNLATDGDSTNDYCSFSTRAATTNRPFLNITYEHN